MDIGKKLKSLRRKKQLTLEDVANRCELSKGFLSQVENNNCSPSISTLEDILDVLGSSLKDFFADDKTDTIVVFRLGIILRTSGGLQDKLSCAKRAEKRCRADKDNDSPGRQVGGGHAA